MSQKETDRRDYNTSHHKSKRSEPRIRLSTSVDEPMDSLGATNSSKEAQYRAQKAFTKYSSSSSRKRPSNKLHEDESYDSSARQHNQQATDQKAATNMEHRNEKHQQQLQSSSEAGGGIASGSTQKPTDKKKMIAASKATDQAIQNQLEIFGSLVGKYIYGQPMVEANGGHHIDKGLQQGRTTLLQALQCDKSIPFGPLTNTKAIIQVPSEGEDSEIDITELVTVGGGATTSQERPTQNSMSANASTQQKPWGAVQDAWAQQNNQGQSANASFQATSFDKLHPHTVKIFHGKVVGEEKGGPRVRDILEQIVDLKSLRPIDSIRRCLPQEHVYSGQLAVYLTLQGLDHHQKAMQIARRLKSWLALYDNQSESPRTGGAALETRPTTIHVYPNQYLENLAGSNVTSNNNSQSANKETHSHRSSSASEERSPHHQGSGSSKVMAAPREQRPAGSRQQQGSQSTICLMQFYDPRALEHVYKVLKNKGKYIVNESKQPIRFGLAYDSRCLGENEWVGVILRNLPVNATSSGIMNNFMKFSPSDTAHYSPRQIIDATPYRITSISEPIKIKDQFCSVITVPDIEEAERICLRWDGMEVNDKHQKLKVHLHPYSYRKRPDDKLSIHSLFKERYDPKKPHVIKQEPVTSSSLVSGGAVMSQNEADGQQSTNNLVAARGDFETVGGSASKEKRISSHDGTNAGAGGASKEQVVPPQPVKFSRQRSGVEIQVPPQTIVKEEKLAAAGDNPTSNDAGTGILNGNKALDHQNSQGRADNATIPQAEQNNIPAAQQPQPSDPALIKQEPQPPASTTFPKGGLLSLLEFDDLMPSKATVSGTKIHDKLQKSSSMGVDDSGPAKLAIMDEFELDSDEAAKQSRRKNKKRLQNQLLEKKREYEKQQSVKEQQQRDAALAGQKRGKHNPHHLVQSNIMPTKRIKREEGTNSAQTKTAGPIADVKDEQSATVVKREEQSTAAEQQWQAQLNLHAAVEQFCHPSPDYTELEGDDFEDANDTPRGCGLRDLDGDGQMMVDQLQVDQQQQQLNNNDDEENDNNDNIEKHNLMEHDDFQDDDDENFKDEISGDDEADHQTMQDAAEFNAAIAVKEEQRGGANDSQCAIFDFEQIPAAAHRKVQLSEIESEGHDEGEQCEAGENKREVREHLPDCIDQGISPLLARQRQETIQKVAKLQKPKHRVIKKRKLEGNNRMVKRGGRKTRLSNQKRTLNAVVKQRNNTIVESDDQNDDREDADDQEEALQRAMDDRPATTKFESVLLSPSAAPEYDQEHNSDGSSQQDDLAAHEQLSSPTEDTENVAIAAGAGASKMLKRQTRSSSNFVDFTNGNGSGKPLLQGKGLSAKQQLGRMINHNNDCSSREITPKIMKPAIQMTHVERRKLISLEEKMEDRIEEGHFLNPALLQLASKHMSICHPEALVLEGTSLTGDEPRKRGPKTKKQKVLELMKNIKQPLRHIQCNISFSIPNEYAQALNMSSNASCSSRMSSTSKSMQQQQPERGEIDSMIQECKTRNMRRKVKEITTTAQKHQQVPQANRSKNKKQDEMADTMAGLPTPPLLAGDTGGQSCLLNLSFDLAVDKLLRLAEGGTVVADPQVQQTEQQQLAAVETTFGAESGANPKKRTAQAGRVNTVMSEAGLTSNVKITASK